MQCPTCGAEVTPEQLTCRECGSDLVALQVVGKLTEGTSAPSRDASIDSLAESSAHADRSGHAADSSRYAEVGVSSFEMEDAESVSIAASSHSREERVAKERAARKAAREQHSAEKEARSAEKEARKAAKQRLKEAKLAYKDAQAAAGKSAMGKIIGVIVLSLACAIGGAAAMYFYTDWRHQADIVALQQRSADLAAAALDKAAAEKEEAVDQAAKKAAAEQKAIDEKAMRDAVAKAKVEAAQKEEEEALRAREEREERDEESSEVTEPLVDDDAVFASDGASMHSGETDSSTSSASSESSRASSSTAASTSNASAASSTVSSSGVGTSHS